MNIPNLIDFTLSADGSRRRKDRNGYLHVEACHLTKEQVRPYAGFEIPNHEKLGLDPQKIYHLLRRPMKSARRRPAPTD